MKVWKLIAGVLSTVIFVIMMVQSCAAGCLNVLEDNGSSSGTVGFICGLLILAGGIVSIATSKSTAKGGNITIIVLFSLAALLGLTGYDNYGDLVIWSIWAMVNVVLAIVGLIVNSRKSS